MTKSSAFSDDLKKVKCFNFFSNPSLSSLAFFFVTLFFVTGLFYSNFETSRNGYFPQWVSWAGSNLSSPGLLLPLILKTCENERVGFLDDRGDGCDIFEGNWIWDEMYPLYKPQDCPFVEDGYTCSSHGRPNDFYTKWRWQPKHCDLPRFDAAKMLEELRNKRVVFTGDSLSRNQWESLLCMLSIAIGNMSSIYEVHGTPITKYKQSLRFKIEGFNCTIEYYRSPFLVPLGHPPEGAPREVKSVLKLDRIARSSRLNGADLLVMSSGHWWTYNKTIAIGRYFQDGGEVKMNMSIEDAYRRAIESVVGWVNSQVDAKKTRVFFRTYSTDHFRMGEWKSGGKCHLEILPDSEPVVGVSYPFQMIALDVLSQKPNNLQVMNVTNMSSRRKDGHPSIYGQSIWNVTTAISGIQDCIHWCLPGVPDSWNELLYALFLKQGLRNSP